MANIKVNHWFINQIWHPVVRYKTSCPYRLQENNAYLLQSEDRKVREAHSKNRIVKITNILISTVARI